MSTEENPEPGYELVMPFVVVTSKGGPYDDDAYVAGYEMGLLDAQLKAGPDRHTVTVRTDNAAQADLLAMRYGYTCQAEPSEEWPEWTYATFTRTTQEASEA